MSEISETEIKSMSKEQNYIRGYEDGKSDVLDRIRAEIEHDMQEAPYMYDDEHLDELYSYQEGLEDALHIIDKCKAESEDKNGGR